jgi:hypothetical protein
VRSDRARCGAHNESFDTAPQSSILGRFGTCGQPGRELPGYTSTMTAITKAEEDDKVEL